MKYPARIAIGICLFVGGLWVTDFIERPNETAAMWIGIMIVSVIINIPAAINKGFDFWRAVK